HRPRAQHPSRVAAELFAPRRHRREPPVLRARSHRARHRRRPEGHGRRAHRARHRRQRRLGSGQEGDRGDVRGDRVACRTQSAVRTAGCQRHGARLNTGMRFSRSSVLVSVAAVCVGCGSAPPPKPAPAPTIPINQKLGWILRLEDKRILRDPAPPAPVAPPPAPSPQSKSTPKIALPPPPPPVIADLTTLATDADPRIRRRAALAIGRVGLAEGAAAVKPLLADADADPRQMAAFALGLLADKTSMPELTAALQDADPRVRGRAAEALGLIGDAGSADAVGQMVAGYVKSGAIASMAPDEEKWGASPEADAVRLGLFALVRLKGYEALTAAIQDGSGRVSGWWPIAYALRRITDPRAAPLLRQLAAT